MVANQLGMRLEFECGDWMTCRQNLEEGKADAILGLETFSNMQHVLKTVPVTTDQLNIYGKNKIESIGALANKKVAVMARSVIMTMFDLQCEYVEYNTNSEILKAVENGEVDYGICHEAVAEKIIEKENLSVVPSLTIMNSFLTFGVWEDKEELRDQMNTILKYYANQGTLARLENKWIVNYSRNRSLNYVIEQNKVFYVAYLITWLFVMFLFEHTKSRLFQEAALHCDASGISVRIRKIQPGSHAGKSGEERLSVTYDPRYTDADQWHNGNGRGYQKELFRPE